MILKRFQWIIANQSQIFFHIPHFAEENGYQYLIIYTAAYFPENVILLQFCSLNYFFLVTCAGFCCWKLKWSIFWHCFSQLKIILRVQKLPYKICLLSVSYDTLFFYHNFCFTVYRSCIYRVILSQDGITLGWQVVLYSLEFLTRENFSVALTLQIRL